MNKLCWLGFSIVAGLFGGFSFAIGLLLASGLIRYMGWS